MKTFHVQRGIVIQNSKVFAAAFKIDEATGSGFKEATESSMRLPEETPSTFKLFVHWLYTGIHPSTKKEPELWGDYEKILKCLVDLYVFGDKYDVPKLRSGVFKALIGATRWTRVLGFHAAAHAYDLTSSGSPLRQLFAIGLALQININWKSELEKSEKSTLSEHPDMMFDILMIMSGRATNPGDEYVIAKLNALLPEVTREKMEDKPQS